MGEFNFGKATTESDTETPLEPTSEADLFLDSIEMVLNGFASFERRVNERLQSEHAWEEDHLKLLVDTVKDIYDLKLKFSLLFQGEIDDC